jgi:DNA-binding response OmpR family regulator
MQWSKAETDLANPAGGAWGMLPARMRVLNVTTRQRTGAWLAEALAADGATEVQLEEAIGAATGLMRLRDEIFDAVLVCHQPGQLDALELVEAVRGGGNDEAIVVLGNSPIEEMDAVCYEAGADGYLCMHSVSTRSLIWTIARATERAALLRANRQLAEAERQRLEAEHQAATRLLDEQRAILGEAVIDPLSGNAAADQNHSLPADLVAHYRELLRAHAMMGSGSLSGELRDLAEMFCGARMSSEQALALHLEALTGVVRALGNRSARHVINRANVVALELLVQLAEAYRQRYLDREIPPKQLSLPSFA